ARRVLSEVGDVYIAETRRRGHATALARAAARNGTDCVVVLGGDGTLNEVATALSGTDTAVAALPGGSTNVFARTLGMPENWVDADRLIAAAINAGSVRPIGLGEANGRFFCFHVGAGWDAALVARVERRAELKRYAGHALFTAAGIRTFFGGYDRTQPHFGVTFPGAGADGSDIVVPDGYFTVVMNSDPYTYVGKRPFTVAPGATLDQPFSVITLRSMRVRAFVPLMFDALADRSGISSNDNVHVVHGVSEVILHRTTSMPFQVDGDYLGEAETLHFRHHPDAVRLVWPATAPAQG
ncbi:MAG: diacylglycerol/lipid kinase family protein, partial [Actinomycetes bacterium]